MPATAAAVRLDPALSAIDHFQSEMDRLGCPASVHLPTGILPADTIELWNEDGEFIALLPDSVSPETAVLAFGLYQLGLRAGQRAGEARAWSNLRTLTRAAPAVAARA